MMSEYYKHILYLGNLRSDKEVEDIEYDIWILFTQSLEIDINQRDIQISQGRVTWHAFVNVHDENNAGFALACLSTWESRRNLKFNFSSLCEASQRLRTGYKKKKKRKNKKHYQNEILTDKCNIDAEDNHENVSRKSKAGRSESKNRDQSEQYSHSPPLVLSAQKYDGSVKSIAGVQHIHLSLEHRKIYFEGQLLGNETRNKEFKKGGTGSKDYLKCLKENVSKYVCGFLNSGEEGTLYFGVTDDGSVIGVQLSQGLEDEWRITIDDAIKSISPLVLTRMYDVKFVDVYLTEDVIKDNFKVIEITVFNTEEKEKLYYTKEGAFIRRDGSIQGPLNAGDIQEWTRQHYAAEMSKLRMQIKDKDDQLNEMMNLQQSFKKSKKTKKSSVCIII